MKNSRTIKSIIYANSFDMGGMPVRQAFPSAKAETIDPFLLLHHAGPQSFDPHGEAHRIEPHPHRGFEPVTFVYKGGVLHRDSLGNEG